MPENRIKRFEEYITREEIMLTRNDQDVRDLESYYTKTMLNDLSEHIEQLGKHIVAINMFLGLNEPSKPWIGTLPPTNPSPKDND